MSFRFWNFSFVSDKIDKINNIDEVDSIDEDVNFF